MNLLENPYQKFLTDAFVYRLFNISIEDLGFL